MFKEVKSCSIYPAFSALCGGSVVLSENDRFYIIYNMQSGPLPDPQTAGKTFPIHGNRFLRKSQSGF